MNWLDSGSNGFCFVIEGDFSFIMKNSFNIYVVFSNIWWGDIGLMMGKISGGIIISKVILIVLVMISSVMKLFMMIMMKVILMI